MTVSQLNLPHAFVATYKLPGNFPAHTWLLYIMSTAVKLMH